MIRGTISPAGRHSPNRYRVLHTAAMAPMWPKMQMSPVGRPRVSDDPTDRVRSDPSNLPEAVETTVPLVGNRAVVEATEMAVVPRAESTAASVGAVFDVDRTLLPGTTAERLFLRYL